MTMKYDGTDLPRPSVTYEIERTADWWMPVAIFAAMLLGSAALYALVLWGV